MNKNIIFIFLATIIFFACEDKKGSLTKPEQENNYGIGVDLEDYFYGFYSDSDISAKYLIFNEIQLGEDLDPDPETDTLNLRSYNDAEYLLTVPGDSFSVYATSLPFSERMGCFCKSSCRWANETFNVADDAQFSEDMTAIECADSSGIWFGENFDINGDNTYKDNIIDSLTFSKSVPWYKEYSLILSEKWNDTDKKYKPTYGAPKYRYDTLQYTQSTTFDSMIYRTVIDSNLTPSSKFSFIDISEFKTSINMISTGQEITIQDTIEYLERIVADSSLLRLKNLDCNQDGKKSPKESRKQPDGTDVDSTYCAENESVFIVDVSPYCLIYTNEDTLVLKSNTVESDCDTLQVGQSVALESGTVIVDSANWIIPGFCDKGNGKYDVAEIHLDLGTVDQIYNSNEPFRDRNCNNVYDSAEEYNHCTYYCTNSSLSSQDICELNGYSWIKGILTDEGFCDTGNGIWDDEEWPDDISDIVYFYDIENNKATIDSDISNWNENEPFFKFSGPLKNLIVDYQDVEQPVHKALEEVTFSKIDTLADGTIDTVQNSVVIKVGDSSEEGWSYYEVDNLITEQTKLTIKTETYPIIDYYQTTYSNVMIEQLDEELTGYCLNSDYSEFSDCDTTWIEPGKDYFIMKSLWPCEATEAGCTDNGYDYNYYAFRKKINGDIAQLTHPVYFTWPGFEVADFDTSNAVEDEIFLHSIVGKLMEGDSLHNDSIIIRPTGNYLVTDDYVVSTDTIAVPYSLGYLHGNGIVICNQDGSEESDYHDCPQDSANIFIDCFKIERTRMVQLVGNAVEWGHRNTIWLANLSSDFKGIIQTSAEYKWSDPIYSTYDNWIAYERWELIDYTLQNGSSRWNTVNRSIEFDQFNDSEKFDYDSYKYLPLFGFHRKYFPGMLD